MRDVDASIAQEPIHLLHTMLGQRTQGLGQAAAHCMDCQRSARQHAHGGVGQRQHPFGMQVAFIQGGDEVQEVVSLERLRGMRPADLDVDACNHILIQSAPPCKLF